MNKFKETTIKSYDWELCWSHEPRLKRELNKDISKARVD